MDVHTCQQRANGSSIPSGTYRLIDVPPEHFPYIWDVAAPMIEAVVSEHADYSADEIVQKLKVGSAQLWMIYFDGSPVGVVVTQLRPYIGGLFCEVALLHCVHNDGWRVLAAELEQWAKQQGCNKMKHECRPGFSKPLKADGYRLTQVVLEKDI